MVSIFKRRRGLPQIPSTPKYKESKRRQGNKTPEITPSPPRSQMPIRIVTEPNNYQRNSRGKRDDSSRGSASSSEESPHETNTILQSVMTNFACVPNLLEDRIPRSLTTIPEEENETPFRHTSLWGIAPSFDSDSGTSKERSIHDNYEVVLDEKKKSPQKCIGSGSPKGRNGATSLRNETNLPLMCHPCTFPLKEDNVKKALFVEETNSIIIGNSQYKGSSASLKKDDTAGKSIDSRLKNDKTCNKKQDSHAAAAENNKAASDTRQMAKKSSVSVKLQPSQRPSSLQSLQSSNHVSKKDSKGDRKTISDHISNMIPPRFRKKTRKLKRSVRRPHMREQRKSVTKVKQGRWKCATAKSGRLYFYHTKTREVSWERPISFVEWKVVRDKFSGQYFFHNSITKEKTITKPKDFVEWKAVHDKPSGRIYYYNIITRQTTWVKPEELFLGEKGESQTTTTTNSDHSPRDKEEEKSHESESTDNSLDEILKSEVKGSNIIDTKKEDKEDERGVVPNDHHGEKQSKEIPSTGVPEPNDDTNIMQTKLKELLSEFCPHEEEQNKLLVNHCKGKESIAIKTIESLVEDTPYDEIPLVVYSQVRSTLQSMGQLPYDETAKSRSIPGPPITKVQTGFSSAYTLKSSSLSQVTGITGDRSNLTELTARINNRSTHINKKSTSPKNSFQKETNLNKSIQDPKIHISSATGNKLLLGRKNSPESENRRQVILDMKVLQEGVRKEKKPFTTPTFEKKKVLELGEKDLHNKNFSHDMDHSDNESSSYAADNDETDVGTWEDIDDSIVSALSDPFNNSAITHEGDMKSSKKKAEQDENNPVSHYLAKARSGTSKLDQNFRQPWDKNSTNRVELPKRELGALSKKQYTGFDTQQRGEISLASSWDNDTFTSRSSVNDRSTDESY